MRRLINRICAASLSVICALSTINMTGITIDAAQDEWNNWRRWQPIPISNAEELAKIGMSEEFPLDGYYVLSQDIDLAGINWTPIGGGYAAKGAASGNGVFTGRFVGGGHTISNLTINLTTDSTKSTDQSGYCQAGFFGTIGSSDFPNSEVTDIKFKNANVVVDMGAGALTAVGILTGELNGSPYINNICFEGGTINVVSSSGLGDLVGVGALAGECRTSDEHGGNAAMVSNIFSNVVITATDPTNNGYASSLIGRVRGQEIALLENCLTIGEVTVNGNIGSGIARAAKGEFHGIATSFENNYILSESAEATKICTELSEGELAKGELALDANSWDFTAGYVPSLITFPLKIQFNPIDSITIIPSQKDTISTVTTDFKVPLTSGDMVITWSTNSQYLTIDKDGNVKVTFPEYGNATAVLTVSILELTRNIEITIIGPNQPKFENINVKTGDSLKVINVPSGTVFNWIITNMITGDVKTINNDTTGQYTLLEADEESMIKVRMNGFEDADMYFSTLPVIYINSDTSYKEVIKEYTGASMSILGNAEYSSEQLYNGDIEIKLRGNSTSGYDKRPFKIKLDTKADLLGLGEGKANKHWVLLANALDHTLLRNKLLLDISGDIGIDPAMQSMNTVLIYNGEYYGVYELCEHVRVDEGRIDIYDWEEYAEDMAKAITNSKFDKDNYFETEVEEFQTGLENYLMTDFSWIDKGYFKFNEVKYIVNEYAVPIPLTNGGFVAEMDFYSLWDQGSVASVITAYSQPLYITEPTPESEEAIQSFMKTDLYEYADKYIQSFEYALHSDDFFYRNEDVHYVVKDVGQFNDSWDNATYLFNDEYNDELNDGKHYSELFDMNSLVANFVFCEYAMNWDSMKNSFLFYKDIDELAKIGPAWDFDWAWGNKISAAIINNTTDYPTSWETTIEEFTLEQYYQSVQWNRMLIRDPYFLVRAYELYHSVRDTYIEDMIKDGGLIDTYSSQLSKAAKANDIKWGYTEGYDDYTTCLNEMIKFVDTRVEWLDKQFASIDTLVNSLGYYQTSDKITINTMDTEDLHGYTKIEATASDNNIAELAFQINGKFLYKAATDSEGKAVIYIPDKALSSKEGELNVVEVKACDSQGEYIINNEYSKEGNYNLVISTFDTFTKKDLYVEKDEVIIGETDSNDKVVIMQIVLFVLLAGFMVLMKLRSKRA